MSIKGLLLPHNGEVISMCVKGVFLLWMLMELIIWDSKRMPWQLRWRKIWIFWTGSLILIKTSIWCTVWSRSGEGKPVCTLWMVSVRTSWCRKYCSALWISNRKNFRKMPMKCPKNVSRMLKWICNLISVRSFILSCPGYLLFLLMDMISVFWSTPEPILQEVFQSRRRIKHSVDPRMDSWKLSYLIQRWYAGGSAVPISEWKCSMLATAPRQILCSVIWKTE